MINLERLKCQAMSLQEADAAAVYITVLMRQHGIYRAALERIADAESGRWGTIAALALKEGREK